MKTIRKKLKNNRGESISEVLIALLISSLGIALLAVMIASSIRIIDTGRKTIERYVDEGNALVVRGSSDLHGTFVLTDSSDDDRLLTKESTQADIPVLYYKNDVIARTPVIAYREE
jgi:hypothetical protein